MGIKTVGSTDPFILPGLLFVGALWVWVSSHSDIASQRGVWVSCVVDT
jgi:hypothetical protein